MSSFHPMSSFASQVRTIDIWNCRQKYFSIALIFNEKTSKKLFFERIKPNLKSLKEITKKKSKDLFSYEWNSKFAHG